MFMGCSVAALFAAITKTFATGAAIVCKLMSNGYRVISGTHYVIYSSSGNFKMGHSDDLRQSHIKTISLFNGISKICC